jgi:hypothetical protein
VKLSEQLAWTRGGWGELVAVASVRVAQANGAAFGWLRRTAQRSPELGTWSGQ